MEKCIFLILTIPALLYAQPSGYVLRPFFPAAFERPLFVRPIPGAPGLYGLIEQDGRFLLVNKQGRLQKKIVFDWRKQTCRRGSEEGLLGFALSPGFPKDSRAYFYVSRCFPRRTEVVRVQFSIRRNQWKVLRTEILLEIPQPYSNHNGGMLEFGPDGLLYIGTGDGGSGGDPHNYAQSLTTLLGKMLRIDVSPARGYQVPRDNPFARSVSKKKEIYAWGLRNPWRFSFDGKRLIAADVGQNRFEEINYIEIGRNYGWRLKEGFACYRPSKGCETRTDLADPVLVYKHNPDCSVTGGYVYRGSKIPALRGQYIFGDFCSGLVRMMPAKQKRNIRKAKVRMKTNLRIASFSLDEGGEILILDYDSGKIFRIER